MATYYFYAYKQHTPDNIWESPEDEQIQLETQDQKQAQRWETHYMIQNYYTAITTEPVDIEQLWISNEAGVLW